MASSFLFDPAFQQKQQAEMEAAAARPLVEQKGSDNLQEHLMQGGIIERDEAPMEDDDFHLLLQEEAALIDRNDYKSIEQLEDEQVDDDTIEKYRRKRRLEMLAAKQAGAEDERAGLKGIVAEMFESEIKTYPGPAVMLLYRLHDEACELMMRILSHLAEKFPQVRFRKMLGVMAVQDFPAENCPTVMVYRGGQVLEQFVKLQAFAGPKTNEEVVEWCLAEADILTTDIEEDPRYTSARFQIKRNYIGKTRRDDIDSDDSDW